MTVYDEFESAFPRLVKSHGLDGKLSEEELAALMGKCFEEINAELAPGETLLERGASTSEIRALFDRLKSKEPDQVTAGVEVSDTIDIGTLTDVRFTSPMWEVVKEARLMGHSAILQALERLHMMKGGESLGRGTQSRGGQSRRARPGMAAAKSGGCLLTIVAIALVSGIAALSAIAATH